MNKYDRVKYNKSPLLEASLQVNFPTILTIDAKEPAEFQEAIRDVYPIYHVQNRKSDLSIPDTDQNPAAALQNQRSQITYFFASEDEKWRIILSSSMIAISSRDYDTWEDMAGRFQSPLSALKEIYRPPFFERVGLRYIDAFNRKDLGVEDREWSELLAPHICGCLGYKAGSDREDIAVNSSIVTAELSIGQVGIRVESGLGTVHQPDGKPDKAAFLLNCDYFMMGKYEEKELHGIAEKIHERSHFFFRDAITDDLHAAMDPVPVGGKG